MLLFFVSFAFLLLDVLVRCQLIQPAAIPLAVRSPYLNSYVDFTTTSTLPRRWPSFWSANRTLGWQGSMIVDGNLYRWLGDPAGLTIDNNKTLSTANLSSIQITPTRTIFVLQAGPMQVNVTFLSPIEPSDLALQSFSFCYVYLDMASTDGNSHSVQVSEDISGEWTSSNNNNIVQWNTTSGSSAIYHEMQRLPYDPMTDENAMAEDITMYHVAIPGTGVNYQTGQDIVLRSRFFNSGSLANTQDTSNRAIQDNWPVLSFSNNLGTITSTASPVVWAIGSVRSPDILYGTTEGTQIRQPYFFTKYNTVQDAISAFMDDASNARQRAISLDEKIVSDANSVSSNYADLVSLAARQTLAGVEITAGMGSDGKLNSSDILMFMKDLGNTQRVNPIEVLYASFPTFLYLNTTWGRYLLEPILKYESSPLYSKTYAAPDLGTGFPSALGNSAPNTLLQIEDSGSMLIMTWAQAKFSGDGTLISRYYSTLKTWADALISQNTLAPTGFVSADGQDNANMTNLAIKGIIGIRAMAEMSGFMGQSNDAINYNSTARSYAMQWADLAGRSGHLASTYQDASSWALIYNLYADKLLGFNLVNSSIYDEQTQFYANQAQSAPSFGLPYDSNDNTVAKSHWTMFTAATVTSNSTRDLLVSMVHTKATDRSTFTVFPSTYNTNNGTASGGAASPAQGAMFALLALNLQSKIQPGTSQGSSIHYSSGSSGASAGAIAGGVVGGLAGLALIVLGFILWRRRSRKAQDLTNEKVPFWSLFTSKKGTKAPAESLDEYHIEPMIMSNDHSRPSPHTHRTTPSSYTFTTADSYSASLGGQPLRLHNGDRETDPLSPDSVYSNEVLPLPRKRRLPATPGPDSSSNSAPSEAGSSDVIASQLRGEVESLRREMEEMRSRAMYEPPPEYV